MSGEHRGVMADLVLALGPQLDRARYRIRVNHARLRLPAGGYYVPDLANIPAELEDAPRRTPGVLNAYEAPLPLVVEIWSPSMEGYDATDKEPGYKARGDFENLRLHPYQRNLVAARRQPDGIYLEPRYQRGTVAAISLPNIAVDLDTLFRYPA